MVKSLLEQLSEMSFVVLDAGDLRNIASTLPREAATNSGVITSAAQMPEYTPLVDGAIELARCAAVSPSRKKVVKLAIDRLAVDCGVKILELVPGRVSTEVDPKLWHDTQATIDKARELAQHYDAAGVPRDRVLMTIGATWEGIRAVELLEREGIHCHATLVFGMHQAVACAQARATLVSVLVGRLLDWHVQHGTLSRPPPAEDPGVRLVARIYEYFRHHGHTTQVMATGFRNVAEVLELAGCDCLTVSPRLLAELRARHGQLVRKLGAENDAAAAIERIDVDESAFRAMHAADRLATDKLAEGIDGFVKAHIALERLLDQRLTGYASTAARNLFAVFDLDGDGFITREEWGGLSTVFDALDLDGDGRIAPEELGLGLGAAFQLR